MNNKGSMAIKTIIYLLILGYGIFAGVKLLSTHFTKATIRDTAGERISQIKGPTTYSPEKAEELLINVLKENNVYENTNQVSVMKTEDGKYIAYEIKYKIRTDLLFFQTDWENVHIREKSDINKRL